MKETGSTNADLLAASRQGAKEGVVLLAEHQNAGRGRQGRTWHDSPRNALLVSWLLRPVQSTVTVLPLLTGLAIADALKRAYGAEVGVKWPNDILSVPTNGGPERKLAGILAEASIQGDDLAVVIGMGLNIEFRDGVPDEIADVATDLASLISGPVPERLELLTQILISVENQLQLLETAGVSRLLDRYRSCCVTLGREVRLETPGGVINGRAVDIEESGALVIETSSGRVSVSAGDTHHVPPSDDAG